MRPMHLLVSLRGRLFFSNYWGLLTKHGAHLPTLTSQYSGDQIILVRSPTVPRQILQNDKINK